MNPVEFETELLGILTRKEHHDVETASSVLYDMTSVKQLLDKDLVRRLFDRYRTAQFAVLNWIYHLEEQEIFTGNYSPRITSEQLHTFLPQTKDQNLEQFVASRDHVIFVENLPILISQLIDRGELVPLSVPPRSTAIVFRSSVAELVRLILNLPFRHWSHGEFALGSSISIVKYHRQVKKVPKWDRDIPSIIEEVVDESTTHFERNGRRFSYDRLTDSERSVFTRCVKSVLEGFQDFASYKMGIAQTDAMLSDYQVKCIKETLRMSYVQSAYPRNLVITAGVGSGKTFAFLLGTLICVLFEKYKHERLNHKNPMLRCLIVYPRVSLSKDQYDTISKESHGLLEWVEKRANQQYNLQLDLSIVPDFGGELYKGSGNVYERLRSLDAHPPDIVITNTETLRRRVKNLAARFYFTDALQFVVFDEVHLYASIEGSHVAKLNERILGRIRYSAGSDQLRPIYMAASATIAQPMEHCRKIFPDVLPGSIQHIAAGESPSLTDFGFFHHILVKAREGRSLLGTLTDLTSCVIHNYFGREGLQTLNRILGANQQFDARAQPKIIGFSDSLSIVSRWRDLVRDQEKSFWKGLWPHGDDPPGVHTYSFPFYGMFHSPLSWRCNVLYRRAREWVEDSKVSKKDLENLKKCCNDASETCKKCKEGKPSTLDFSSNLSGHLLDFARSNLLPPYPDRQIVPTRIDNMENCPFFQSGICWWSSSSSAQVFQEVPTETGPPLVGYSDNIRTKISTSRVRETVKNPNDEFAGPFNEIYGSSYSRGMKIADAKLLVPFLISSPVLEVGVDISNVKGTILHKAIRNLSSYKQKVGRGGRELNAHSLAVTLISGRPAERHYFRNSFLLADPNVLEPIPLKRNNLDVQKSHALEACFDFCATIGWDIYNIPKKRRDFDTDKVGFSERVKSLLNSDLLHYENGSFKDKRLFNYLMNTLRTSEKTATEAILIFKRYMETLASDKVSSMLSPQADCLASMWEDVLDGSALLSVPGESSDNYEQDFEQLQTLSQDLKNLLPTLRPEPASRIRQLFGVD